ncbi:hypothetical protein D5086_016085 [Populus alba]|uniref:Uncharacterized protein n=1 Tax=Populus alba TaxID=43335 RepID=A0ACC4BT04_POPAL
MGSQRLDDHFFLVLAGLENLPYQFRVMSNEEDGWVVCRVFKKKNQTRGFVPEVSQELFSPDSAVAPSFVSPLSLNNMNDIECSQDLLRLAPSGCGFVHPAGRFNGDWSFLDKLLASHQNLDHQQHYHNKRNSSSQIVDPVGASTQKFPFQYLGFETDILRFSK